MLTTERKAEYLAQGLFGGLDPETRLAVAQRMGQRDLADGETLFLQGEPGDELYIVIEGGIEVVLASSVIAVLGPGQVLGEMAVLGGGRRTASARAKGAARLLFLKAKAIRLLVHQAPDLAFGFFRVLIDRLEESSRLSQFLASNPPALGRLEGESGPVAGKRLPLRHAEAILGRARGSLADALRIALPDDSLAERHARVRIRTDGIYLEPEQGEVRVNGETVEGMIEVASGDRIEAGRCAFRLLAGAAP